MNVGEFLCQKHHFANGLYAKEMCIPANHIVGSHKHKYSHLSLLASGLVSVTVENITTEYKAPACIEIKAGLEHQILAKVDSVWFCIHATNETDLEKIDEVLIIKGN